MMTTGGLCKQITVVDRKLNLVIKIKQQTPQKMKVSVSLNIF